LVQLFLTVMAIVSTWKRLVLVLILGSSMLCGWLIYRDPERVYAVLDAATRPKPLSPGQMSYLYTDIQRELTRLQRSLGDTGMVGVTAWRVDLQTNRAKLVTYASVPEIQAKIEALRAGRWSLELAFFTVNPRINNLLGTIIAGHFVCSKAADTWDALDQLPVIEICLIGVPPDAGAGFAGFLGGAWRYPIQEIERERIAVAFRTAAEELVWKSQ